MNLVREELSYRISIQRAHVLSNEFEECCKILNRIVYSIDDIERTLANSRTGVEYFKPYIRRLCELVYAGDAAIYGYTNIRKLQSHINETLRNIYSDLNGLQSKKEMNFTTLSLKKRKVDELLNALEIYIRSVIGKINVFLGTLNAIKNEFWQ
ncbi:hypothetical protein NPIL_33251 [Nephila pilipes]|uniref:Uncharacterized protein n=1 Tax=Nephila pilipes TaxID=299642 RepID=A0A8X6NLS3_NEPPI|nr:hypothetical protein NPIL_49391 [Nephila pilipes]GFT63275.1 hypothetical protein NPIL_33251 [Nephila pilipes]